MGKISGHREYIPKTFEREAIFNSLQKIFEITGVHDNELNITARYTYEGGITENRNLSVDNVKDICCINKQPNNLLLYSENLSINFTRIYTDQISVAVFSNTIETVKLTLDILEKQLSLQELRCEIKPKTEISEGLIRELIKDGERLVNKEDHHKDTPITTRREAMNDKIIPALKPQLVDVDIFCEYTPEKLELFDGIVLGDIQESKKLLLLLLYNIGLQETIKLAPKELWEQAINFLKE